MVTKSKENRTSAGSGVDAIKSSANILIKLYVNKIKAEPGKKRKKKRNKGKNKQRTK